MNETTDYPEGEYAIVELFGHTTLVGRIAETERFGAKMLAIEPLFDGRLLPTVFYGGGSIYGLTPCSAAVAFQKSPKREWSLPGSIRCILPTLPLADASAIQGAAQEVQETVTDEPEPTTDNYGSDGSGGY